MSIVFACNLALVLTHLPLDKMATISQTIFWNAFSLMQSLCFDQNFTEICPQDQINNNLALV